MKKRRKNKIEKIGKLIRKESRNDDNKIDFDDYLNAFRMATKSFDEDLIEIKKKLRSNLKKNNQKPLVGNQYYEYSKDITELMKKYELPSNYRRYLGGIVSSEKKIKKRIFLRGRKNIEIDINLKEETVGIMLNYSANKTEVINFIKGNWDYIEKQLILVASMHNKNLQKRKPYNSNIINYLKIFKLKEYNFSTKKIGELLGGKYDYLKIEKIYSEMRIKAKEFGIKTRPTKRGNRKK